MKRGCKFLVQISFILISFLLIDGGKTFILLGNNIHYAIDHKHNGDLEIPDTENYTKMVDEEKWISTPQKEMSGSGNTITHFSSIRNLNPRDFSTSIWQPPKFI
jgi:hypothetical protein